MENSYLFFVAIDIGCFLLLALLFSGVSGKNEMSFGERYILFGFILYSGFCHVAVALLQLVNYMHYNLYRNDGYLHCTGVISGTHSDEYA